MKKVIITGANGFIGSKLTRYFSSRNIRVQAIVLRGTDTSCLPKDPYVTIIEWDYKNIENILPLLPNDGCDAVYHFAWQGVSQSERVSMEKQLANIDLCLMAVRLAKLVNAKKIILPGNTTEYGYSKGLINGDSKPTALNAYGAVKISTRYLCSVLAHELGVSFIYAVFAGVYSSDRRNRNVIFYTIDELLHKRKPKLSALKQLWDYIYIDDLLEAAYLIGEKGKDGAFYAVGHGDNIPLCDYIYKIRDIIDPSLPLGIGEIPYDGGRIPSSCIDMTALREDTGFVPKVDFEEGIRKVISQLKGEGGIE